MLYLVGEHDCPPLVEDAHAEDVDQIVALHVQPGDGPEVVMNADPLLVERLPC